MLSPYQKMLLEDIGGPMGYGSALIAWKGQQEFFRGKAPQGVGTHLSPDLAMTFVEQVYVLLRTGRKISIYRGYETAGLEAPFGKDHLSYMRNLVTQRKPGTPDGWWWTPSRPSMEIDDLKLPEMHRAAPQQESAAYGGKKLGGGGYQFRLTQAPETLPWMKAFSSSVASFGPQPETRRYEEGPIAADPSVAADVPRVTDGQESRAQPG